MKNIKYFSFFAFLLVASSAWGAVFDVDRFDDTSTDTACTAAANDCSLRGAIIAANTNAGNDTINVPSGTYTLSLKTSCEDAAINGDLDVTGALTIKGAGVGTTIIDADGVDRVFDIISQQQTFTVTISDLTIQNGVAHDVFESVGCGNGGDGGNIHVANSTVLALNKVRVLSGEASQGSGGGIFSNGTVVLVDSTIDGNTADFRGGGLLNSAEHLAIIANSTISRNQVGRSGQSEGNGGGIANNNSATLLLVNSTISGNMAFGSDVAGNGGGIFVDLFGTTSLRNVTITNNTADASGTGSGDGGGVFLQNPGTAASPALILRNSIIAGNNDGSSGNVFPDCFNQSSGAVVVSEDFNLIGDETGCDGDFTGSGDLVGTGAAPIDPLLGPLTNNGGPTETHALLLVPTMSPAIDSANPAGCFSNDTNDGGLLTQDQRGSVRPFDGGAAGPSPVQCDIGAFELGGCGDGKIDAGEECDDGNLTDGDGCSSVCLNEVVPACGDGILQSGEECDDGNTADGDGCSAFCKNEVENLLGVGGCSLVNR